MTSLKRGLRKKFLLLQNSVLNHNSALYGMTSINQIPFTNFSESLEFLNIPLVSLRFFFNFKIFDWFMYKSL